MAYILPEHPLENQGKSGGSRFAFDSKAVIAGLSIHAVIESRGIELHPSGPGRWRASCPFHAEKTPSFFVFENSNRYHCFGCQESGDPIDFIRKLDGLSFRDAVQLLTGERPGRHRPNQAVVRKRKADAGLRKWLSSYSSFLGTVICGCRTLLYWECREPEDIDRFAGIIDLQSRAELHLDAIIDGDPERLTEVFRQFLSGKLNYV